MSPRWRDWFAAGVLKMGLSPEAFWALTLSEWRALLEAGRPGAGGAMSRAELTALLAQHEDGERT